MGMCLIPEPRTFKKEARVRAITDKRSFSASDEHQLDALDTVFQILAIKLEERMKNQPETVNAK